MSLSTFINTHQYFLSHNHVPSYPAFFDGSEIVTLCLDKGGGTHVVQHTEVLVLLVDHLMNVFFIIKD